jgi:hypothetical protein
MKFIGGKSIKSVNEDGFVGKGGQNGMRRLESINKMQTKNKNQNQKS